MLLQRCSTAVLQAQHTEVHLEPKDSDLSNAVSVALERAPQTLP